jgi:Lon protease-like protein
MSRTLRVPLFPLPGAILFPRSQLPLHIFEPRYREMVRDAIEGADRIAMIQPHRIDHDNQAPLFDVGCVGDIVGIEELDDGRFNIVLLGANRFRLIKEAKVDAPYRCADVDIEALDDANPSRCRSASARRSSARLAGWAKRWAWRSTGRRSPGSTTRCWSTRSPRSRRSTSAPSRRCSSNPRSPGAPTCSCN